MQKTINQFATVTENGVVTKIGRSQILTPKTNYQGGKMKYFDDSKLIKKNRK